MSQPICRSSFSRPMPSSATSARRQAVAASFVPRKVRLVEKQNVQPAPGQDLRRRCAAGAGADDDDVVLSRHQSVEPPNPCCVAHGRAGGDTCLSQFYRGWQRFHGLCYKPKWVERQCSKSEARRVSRPAQRCFGPKSGPQHDITTKLEYTQSRYHWPSIASTREASSGVARRGRPASTMAGIQLNSRTPSGVSAAEKMAV